MAWKNVQYENGKFRTNEGGGGGGASTFADLDDVSFSNLQNGQVPKYNSNTQKWENANESGGGGTVTDVEVDGVSVVNQQGVAEIPAIPDGLHHYSTTEQVIGTWIDGKPIYERVIDLGQLPNTNTKVVQTVDVYPDTIVSFEAYAKRHIVGSSKGTFTLPFVSGTLAAQISCYIDVFDDNPTALCVTITTGNDRSNMTGHAIVRYTKTTD